MGKPTSRMHPHQGAPEWVFQWRQPMGSPLHKWVAILMVGGGFAFFLTSVRIRVVPPTPWATHKASVIHVTDDAEGRMLTLRAREGGPFPSRFEPSAWDGAAALERSAFEAARWTPPAYIPELRNLPDEVTPPVPLAVKGERILPKLRPESVAAPVAGNSGRLRSFTRCPGSRRRRCLANCRPLMARSTRPWPPSHGAF